MEIITNESEPKTQSPEQELYQATVESATRAVGQARQELANATTEDQKIIWSNRLGQRLERLKMIARESNIELSEEDKRDLEEAA